MSDDLASRLEMFLVLSWLEAGADPEEPLRLTPHDFAAGLNLEGDDLILTILEGLGELEERGAVGVAWSVQPSAGRIAEVHLSPELRTDARRLFGRD